MRHILYLSVLFIAFSSYGQKIRISIKPDSVDFLLNGMIDTPPKIREIDPTWIYIAKKKGYVNQGFTFAEVAKKATVDKKGRSNYTIELEKIQRLPNDYVSKLIEVYKLSDKTGRIIEFNFSDPFFTTELSNKLIAYGYKNVVNADLFDNKQKETQLKIVGEIVEFSRNTIGPRFQISLMINWSVYDALENKVVLQCSSVGFSNTESRFKSEFGYALRNALVGLMSNTDFQQLARASSEKMGE